MLVCRAFNSIQSSIPGRERPVQGSLLIFITAGLTAIIDCGDYEHTFGRVELWLFIRFEWDCSLDLNGWILCKFKVPKSISNHSSKVIYTQGLAYCHLLTDYEEDFHEEVLLIRYELKGCLADLEWTRPFWNILTAETYPKRAIDDVSNDLAHYLPRRCPYGREA